MEWVFFDFDGLLADTEPLHMKAFDQAFAKLGIHAKSDPKNWVGRASRDVLQEVVVNTKTSVPIETIRQTRRKIYREIAGQAHLMPFAKEALAWIGKRFQLGVVTSSSIEEITPVFEKHKLGGFFQVIVTWDQKLRPKPAPDMYREAIRLAKTKADKAASLEDSSRGVQAAKAAGLYCIAVPNPFTKGQDLSKADRKTRDLLEAAAFLSSAPSSFGNRDSP